MPSKLASRTPLILAAIWLLSNLGDRLWLALDRAVPAWDQSNHLTNALKYFQFLQSPQFLNGEWWHNFWMLSSKYPPLTYIVTALCQKVFGLEADSALTINWFYSAVLLLATYTIGKTLFSREVGWWAAGLTVLLPRLYQTRLEYLLDAPATAMIVACFACLTQWRSQKTRRGQWLWAFSFGLSWGLALLTKQNVMFFLLVPLLWVGISQVWQGQWQRIGQLIVSFLVSVAIWWPWYRTNWIYLFSTAQNSNAIPAAAEGDPRLNTLPAWTYYWQDLPRAVSWVLLLVPLVGLLLHLLGRFPSAKEGVNGKQARQGIGWLALYFFSSYLLCSAIFNKDPRYIMPYLPILAVFLAYGLTQWRGKWQGVRWGTVALAILVMGGKLFPWPGLDAVASVLSPGWLSHPYLGPLIPDAPLIETVIQNAPYQKSNLGVIVNVNPVNHNTLSYYGALADWQVYGRELGTKEADVAQDGRSFDWFVTKTGHNGFARESQLALAEKLEKNPDFALIKQWPLPDDSLLKLYHRQLPTVTVRPLSQPRERVQLDRVTVPAKVPPGVPMPVTYEWSGPGQQLAAGLVLLTWQRKENSASDSFWIHDRGLGRGLLHFPTSQPGGFQVIERTAMLPSGNLLSGDYTLTATYLNRQTGETYPLTVPPVTVTLAADAPAVAAPELDFVTQLRQLSLDLAQGVPGLTPIFRQVDRLNRYDPLQDYLQQAEKSLQYRLSHGPCQGELEWTYGLVLSQVLQEDPDGAIATLKRLVKLAPDNAYSHAYLAFVYLYNWQPKAAQQALKPALELQPNVPEIRALDGISALMQGNFIKAWQILKS